MYYTTWSQLLFWDTICTWQYRVFSEMKAWKLMIHCIAAGSWKFPNSESFISQNIWHLCSWECRRLGRLPPHRSDLGLPRGGHGARRGQPDLWQLVVYGLPVIVQGRSLPIHNTHHILFLGNKHKLIVSSVFQLLLFTWKMMPAVPTSTATVKIQRKSLSRTCATYFQSSMIWTKAGYCQRELSKMSSFSLFKRLKGLFVLYALTLIFSSWYFFVSAMNKIPSRAL